MISLQTKLTTLLLLFFSVPLFAQLPGWTVYQEFDPFPYDQVRYVSISPNGIVLTGSDASGVASFDGSTWTYYNTANSGLAHDNIRHIHIDKNDNFWISTQSVGVSMFDGATWTTYNKNNSDLRNDIVYTINSDDQGNVYFGYPAEGFSIFDGTTWTHYSNSQPGWDVGNDVRDFFITASGDIWVATTTGLVHFDGTTWTSYDPNNSGMPDDGVSEVAIDDNGEVWLGMFDAGLVHYDFTTWTNWTMVNSDLPNDHLWGIMIDGDDKWITTSNGLVKFDGTDFTLYNTGNSALTNDQLGDVAFEQCNGSMSRVWIHVGGATPSIASFFPDVHDICLVTHDSVSQNVIVWEQRPSDVVDSIIVLRETAITDSFLRIGAVGYNDASTFTDTSADQQTFARRYRIDTKDACGHIANSTIHKTLHLSVSKGVANEINLSWNDYEGIDFATYDIYGGINNNSQTKIASVPKGTIAYTHSAPAASIWTYHVQFDYPSGCTTLGGQTITSISSKTVAVVNPDSVTNVIPELAKTAIQIFPNPAKEQLHIKLPAEQSASQVVLYNVAGERVYATTCNTNLLLIPVEHYPHGLYLVEVSNEFGVTHEKVMIE